MAAHAAAAPDQARIQHQLVGQEVQEPMPMSQQARIQHLLAKQHQQVEQKGQAPVPMTIDEQVTAFTLLSTDQLHALVSLLSADELHD